MTRWVIACIAMACAPATLIGAQPPGATTAVVAVAVIASLALVSVAATRAGCQPIPTWRPAPPVAGAQARHRHGAFRRQHAPDAPGRPCRPRAPGGSPAGPTH